MLNKIGSQLAIKTVIASDLRPGTPEAKVIEAKRADFVYFRSRAISALDQGPEKGVPNPNGNGDGFPKAELQKSYETFVGRNLFLNHESDHPVKSIGKIIDAYEVEDPETGEYYIECLSKIDKKLHPEIARKVETGELDKVSMGCSCEASKCSICGTEIHTDADQKCAHLAGGLLKDYTAEIDMPEYGIVKGQPMKAFAINSGLTFNELSIVNVPADSRAVIKTVLANINNQLTKKASLDVTAQAQLIASIEKVLSELDVTTREAVQAEFCAHQPKETAMSDEQAQVNDILKKMNAFDYTRLVKSIEKKEAKAEIKAEVKAIAKAEPVKEERMKSIIEKAKNSVAGKMFAQAIKRLVAEDSLPKVEADKKTHTEDCMDANDDTSVFKGKCICPKEAKAAQDVRAEFKENKEQILQSTWSLMEGEKALVTATLKDIWASDFELMSFEDQKWATSNEYGNELVARYQDKENGGVEKIATLLGLTAAEVKTDYKVSKPEGEFVKPGAESKADKEADKTKEAIEKVDSQEVGGHLDSSIPELGKKAEVKKEECMAADCEVCEKCDKDRKKCECARVMPTEKVAAEMPKELQCEKCKCAGHPMTPGDVRCEKCTCSTLEHKTAAEAPAIDLEVKPELTEAPAEEKPMEEAPMEAPAPDAIPAPEDGSAFDKLDEKIVLGDGYEATKDKETKEIIVTKDGQEFKRLPDGFGDDLPTVMSLLQSVLGLPTAGEAKSESPLDAPAPETPKAEEPMPEGEPKQEQVNHEQDAPSLAFSAQEAKLKKQAEELAVKQAELEAKSKAIDAEKQKLAASAFSTTLNARVEKCKRLVEAMFEKDLLVADDAVISAALEDDKELLEAKKLGFEATANKQVRKLMAMDEKSLGAFAETVAGVTKVAKSLTKLPHINWSVEGPSQDAEIAEIFGSMGKIRSPK